MTKISLIYDWSHVQSFKKKRGKNTMKIFVKKFLPVSAVPRCLSTEWSQTLRSTKLSLLRSTTPLPTPPHLSSSSDSGKLWKVGRRHVPHLGADGQEDVDVRDVHNLPGARPHQDVQDPSQGLPQLSSHTRRPLLAGEHTEHNAKFFWLSISTPELCLEFKILSQDLANTTIWKLNLTQYYQKIKRLFGSY